MLDLLFRTTVVIIAMLLLSIIYVILLSIQYPTWTVSFLFLIQLPKFSNELVLLCCLVCHEQNPAYFFLSIANFPLQIIPTCMVITVNS